MDNITSREEILKRVRNASMINTDNPYANVDLDSTIYPSNDEDLEVIFAEELNHIGGNFVYCESINELENNLLHLAKTQKWETVFSANPEISKLLDSLKINNSAVNSDYSKTNVSITSCESLVARLGSVVISSKQTNGRRLNFIPNVHIVIGYREQIVATIKDATNLIEEKYGDNWPSMTTVITGPSRTADIEKTLVMGAHGPRTLIVFLLEENFLNLD
jgi:L-lactate dehydrogenase complex protein LldG